ncbi:helix-turn-helix domain-containing protein [Geopsychrobacter electrodiphilus]|uniref:helix-turn-helix domain-containing protein n=1 Tax=Geopsychrobacter electrodiphilus TaxID=225196 RepID=UPI00146A2C08|nr:helix-turn-helix transcriptional regulator [Geopsychrobacter electrodiphilus]
MAIIKKNKQAQNGNMPELNEITQEKLRDIGNRVRMIRETSESSTQVSFASLLGVSVAKLNRIENARRAPDLEFLLRFKRKAGCDLNWLLTGDGLDQDTFTETTKANLLLLLREDDVFRTEILDELGIRPHDEVKKVGQIYNGLQNQYLDLVELVANTIKLVEDGSKEKKIEAGKYLEKYRERIDYLQVLLEVGR